MYTTFSLQPMGQARLGPHYLPLFFRVLSKGVSVIFSLHFLFHWRNCCRLWYRLAVRYHDNFFALFACLRSHKNVTIVQDEIFVVQHNFVHFYQQLPKTGLVHAAQHTMCMRKAFLMSITSGSVPFRSVPFRVLYFPVWHLCTGVLLKEKKQAYRLAFY